MLKVLVLIFNYYEINLLKVSAAIYEFVPLDDSISKDIGLEDDFNLEEYVDAVINGENQNYSIIKSILELCLAQERVVFSRNGNSASLQNYFGDPKAKISEIELKALIEKLSAIY